MAKSVKWHSGTEAMCSKKSYKKQIEDVKINGHLFASKSNFILLARRANLDSWKRAVEAVLPAKEAETAISCLANGLEIEVYKHELRKASKLVS